MDNSRKRNKVVSSEGNWAMPLDLLLIVAGKINSLEDYFAFRRVCAGWRLAAFYEHDFNKSRCKLPLLLEITQDEISDDEISGDEVSSEGLKNSNAELVVMRNFVRRFSNEMAIPFGFTTRVVKRLKFSTPLETQPHSIAAVANNARVVTLRKLVKEWSKETEIKNCLGCRGWILVVHSNGDMYLVHVISGYRISLPQHQKSFECKFGINKMILSSSPFTNRLDFTLVIVYHVGKIAYWRPGDKTFTEIQTRQLVTDIIYLSTKGVFYGLSKFQIILSIDGNKQELAVSSQYIIPPCLPRSTSIYWNLDKFLVESDGDLLLVVQHEGKVEDLVFDDILGCERVFGFYFRVYKIGEVDESCFKYGVEEMKNLGNRALFVGGLGASISVKASDVPGCKQNHIYYTGHNRKGKSAHAVYNLANGLIDSSGWGILSEEFIGSYPSLWVTPTTFV